MILTPKRIEQRAEFYRQVSTMMDAGLSLIQSLQILNRPHHFRMFAQPISRLLKRLEQGATFTEAAASIRWVSDFDLALFDVGEKSGRLDACFRLLAEFYHQRAKALRKAIGHLLYPLFVVHVAILLFPFPELFLTGNFSRYLIQIGSFFVPLYSLIFIVMYLSQGQHGTLIRSILEKVFAQVPLLGMGQKALSLSRFCLSLQSLLNAGTNMGQAWRLAANASGSPQLQREVASYEMQIEKGKTPGELLSHSRFFPEMFVSTYQNGEISGRIDTNLKRMHTHFQDEGFGKLELFAFWFPWLIYLFILMGVAFHILRSFPFY